MPKTLKHLIRFQMDPEAKLTVAHGVWGGVTSRGEIEMNFFSESEEMPEAILRTLDENGNILGEELRPDAAELHNATRTITSRVLINLDTAVALSEWLNEQIGILEEYNNYQSYEDASIPDKSKPKRQ